MSEYKDQLVKVNSKGIHFFRYYFPTKKEKYVSWENVDRIVVLEPSFMNGKYRFWGSGSLLTWFPMDMQRNKRDKIFLMYLKNSMINIGFTVQDSSAFVKVVKSLVILKEEY